MSKSLYPCIALATAISMAASAAGNPPTFNRDIAPIVFGKCMACHREGEVAPFPLTNFVEVSRRSRQIVMVTERHIMPPWKPTDASGVFKDDRSLTDEQIALFKSWAENGKAEGDAADLPDAPEFPSGWHLGEPDMVVGLQEPFKVSAEGLDVYVHFVFPMDLKQDKYIQAVQVLPSNPRVAHHGVILLDGSGNARKLAAKQGGDHYFNFGDPGFLTRGFLPGFAPGQATRQRDASDSAGVGLTLKKGLDIVLQMHYHPTGRDETDQPRIGLYFTDEKPIRGPNIIGMANNDVDIPPGEKEFKRVDTYKLPVDFEVRDIWGHMHLLGKRMKVDAVLPDGEKRNLLLIDDWDFNWQDSYVYKEPFVLPKGTDIHAEWTWDNSAANPRNPYSPPRRVQWGPSSTDEMSGLIIGGITKNPGWDEGVMWLSVIGHYLKIERDAKLAQKKRNAIQAPVSASTGLSE